jgi:hypothetical protein
MTNADIFNLIDFIIDKEKSGGTITPDQKNLSLKTQQTRYLDILRSEYEKTGKISSIFEVLRKYTSSDLAIDANGYATLPNDFLFTDGGSLYLETIGSTVYPRPIDIVTSGEWNKRLANSLRVPTTKHDIQRIVGTKIQFGALKSQYVKFQYIRKPVDPYLDYYVDSNNNLIYREVDGTTIGEVVGDDYNQLSNLVLTGVTALNSDQFYLYWEIFYNVDTSLYELNFYKDSDKTALVAQGTTATTGSVTINQANASGISGTVTMTVIAYLTIVNDSLNEIGALEMLGFTTSRDFYWEIKCQPFSGNGSTGVTTSFYLYNDSARKSRYLYLYNLSSSFIKTFNVGEISGSVSITNALKETITGTYASVLTNFMVLTPLLYNLTEFYYTLTDNIVSQTLDIYTDSSRTIKVMTATRNAPYTSLTNLTTAYSSGYTGFINIDTVYTYDIQGDTAGQLSNLTLSGITSANSDGGDLYYKIVTGSGYCTVDVYRESTHLTPPVAFGSLPIGQTSGVITFTSTYGISGSVTLNYTAPDTDAANKFVPHEDYTHNGSIAYQSGSWSIGNKIEIRQMMDAGKKVLVLPTSQTVEMELRDEDKLHILGMILQDIGVSIGSDLIAKYAEAYKTVLP